MKRIKIFISSEDFRIVIWRSFENGGAQEASQSVPDKELELLNLIRKNPAISRAKLSEILGISVRQVRNITDKLKNDGTLTRDGGDSGRWNVNNHKH